VTRLAAAVMGRVLRDAVDRLRAAGIATAQQDGELLLARVIGTTRLGLHLEPSREIEADRLAELDGLVARRTRHEPLQYLLGTDEFHGLRLALGAGVFIPRPETELLVERALAVCPDGPAVILDLCTGSGAVACALAAFRRRDTVWAVELSPDAAGWARHNVARLGLAGRVRVVEGDLFAAVADLVGACDVIVANPPYLPGPALATLPDEVRAWEPRLALDGGPDGLAVVDRILAAAPRFARAGGWLLLEIGDEHAGPLRARLAADARYGEPALHRDVSGTERVLAVPIREHR
jgi:release factor glutamine methyltransferase